MNLREFLQESNRIEKIDLPISPHEVRMSETFLSLMEITVGDMKLIAEIFQPDAQLRDRPGMNVQVGNHIPVKGGPDIYEHLQDHLRHLKYFTPHRNHMDYETLHPFTDCNGRTGRLLWLWEMGGIENAPLGFLHTFYYQTLSELR